VIKIVAANLTDTITEKEIIDKIIPAYKHIQTGRRNKPSSVAFIVAIVSPDGHRWGIAGPQ